MTMNFFFFSIQSSTSYNVIRMKVLKTRALEFMLCGSNNSIIRLLIVTPLNSQPVTSTLFCMSSKEGRRVNSLSL